MTNEEIESLPEHAQAKWGRSPIIVVLGHLPEGAPGT